MKKQAFLVNHGTYPFDVLVCVGMSHCEVIKYLKRYGYSPDDEEREKLEMPGGGRTVILKGNQTVIWVVASKSKTFFHSNLAHEIFHAVEFLMDRIGSKYSLETGETWAYQIQYLTKKIYEKLK